MLANKAQRICVAYDDLDRYFPSEKIVKTGNPIRAEILHIIDKDPDGYRFFQFVPDKRTILVVGGSLGARTLNETMLTHLAEFRQADLQLLWQTGEQFFKAHEQNLQAEQDEHIRIVPFIRNMNEAYGMADIIVSRAGAMALSELAIVGKPVILVPFPYAAEDHQTYNAKALSSKEAAILIADKNAKNQLIPQLMTLVNNPALCQKMGTNLRSFAQPDAINKIYTEIERIVRKK